MKIRQVGAQLLRADRQTDRHEEANSRFFAILRTRLTNWSLSTLLQLRGRTVIRKAYLIPLSFCMGF